jgi:hypothetical protein
MSHKTKLTSHLWDMLRNCCLHQAGAISFHAFNLDDGGHIFLYNNGWLSTDYTGLYPRRYNS